MLSRRRFGQAKASCARRWWIGPGSFAAPPGWERVGMGNVAALDTSCRTRPAPADASGSCSTCVLMVRPDDGVDLGVWHRVPPSVSADTGRYAHPSACGESGSDASPADRAGSPPRTSPPCCERSTPMIPFASTSPSATSVWRRAAQRIRSNASWTPGARRVARGPFA